MDTKKLLPHKSQKQEARMDTKALFKMHLKRNLDLLNNQYYHIDQNIYNNIIDKLVDKPSNPNIQGVLTTLDSFKKTTAVSYECATMEFLLLKDEFFNEKKDELNVSATHLNMEPDFLKNRNKQERLKWFRNFQNEQAPFIYEQARINGNSIYQCVEYLSREFGASAHEMEEKISKSVYRHYMKRAAVALTVIAGAFASTGATIYHITKSAPKQEPKIEQVKLEKQLGRE